MAKLHMLHIKSFEEGLLYFQIILGLCEVKI